MGARAAGAGLSGGYRAGRRYAEYKNWRERQRRTAVRHRYCRRLRIALATWHASLDRSEGRLATLRAVDRILVLHHGQLAEEGSHEELLRREGGIYRALLEELQARRFPCLAETLRLSKTRRLTIAASVWLGLSTSSLRWVGAPGLSGGSP